MAVSLIEATYRITEADLARMMLDREQLPTDLRDFHAVRETVLDNATMAEHGFPGNSPEKFRDMGRITGYVREFLSPQGASPSRPGPDIMAATVAHLFDSPESVLRWMNEMFLGQFEANVGKAAGPGLELVSVERLDISGFHDEAIALKAVQRGPTGLHSSTVVDFRVGRVLGVAFVVAEGEVTRIGPATYLALELERQIVRVALDVPLKV